MDEGCVDLFMENPSQSYKILACHMDYTVLPPTKLNSHAT